MPSSQGGVSHTSAPGPGLRRALGPFDAAMVVIGGIIGAGIFINPYLVARTLDTPWLVLAAWAAGGAVALAGAFAYAELGRRLPRAGGQYVYLGEAWHPLVGFLYGWALLLLIETGAMAAVAITFAEYALRLVGTTGGSPRLVAVSAIVLLTVVNYLGVKPGSRVLNVFVVLKVAALAALIVLAWATPSAQDWLARGRADETPSGLVAFGAAMIPVLFAYGGWQTANYLAEEMRDPRRHLPVSLISGTIVVVVVYVLINVAYLRSLGLEGLAATTTPAADAAGLWLGAAGERFIAAAIAVSTFGFLNHAILSATRVYYAMGADRVFLPAFGRIHPRFGTPSVAIVAQSGWAIALTLTGTYGELLGTVVFADWIFFGLTVAGLFVLRRRDPEEAGYRMPGFPWLPGAFVLVALAVVVSSILAAPLRSAVGAGLILAGVPVFWWCRRT